MQRLFGREAQIAVLASFLLVACAKLPGGYSSPTPLPTPSVSNKPIYTVQRGTIDQVVESVGRVAAGDEAVTYFRQAGRLDHLYVATDQSVKRGDLLADLDTGSLKNQMQIAQFQADIAQFKVDQAMGKNIPGLTEPAAVSSARANVAKAEAEYARAQDALTALVKGSTSADTAAAQAGIGAAQAQVAEAKQNLSGLQAQPRPEDIKRAQLALDQAKDTLYSVQVSRDATCGTYGRQSAQCESGNASVSAQQTAVSAAQTKLDVVNQPAQPEQITAATASVTSAEANLVAAQEKLALVQRGPTATDIDAAKQNVASAHAVLDGAQSDLASAQGTFAETSIDVQIAKKQASIANLQVAELQQELDNAQVRAPFDGVVTETDANVGDQIQPSTPILIVSNPAKLEIAVDLHAGDLTTIALGQRATIVLNAYPTAQLSGMVIGVPSIATAKTPSSPSTFRSVRLSFTPPAGAVNLGDQANVAIEVQRKDAVIVLPTTAVQTFGGRRFVRLLTADNTRREVDVQIGISDDTNTEITQGLQEGDKVIAP